MSEIVATDDLKAFAAYVGTLKNRIEALERSGALTQTEANGLYALIAHSHAQSDISGLVATLAAKEAAGTAAGLIAVHEAAANPHPLYALDTDLAGKANVSHTHVAADITDFTSAVEAIATGGNVGTATLDFGAEPADGAAMTVTDASVSAASYVNAWVQANDTATGNDASDHSAAAASLRFLITPASGSFDLEAHSTFGLATGQFKVRYSVQ